MNFFCLNAFLGHILGSKITNVLDLELSPDDKYAAAYTSNNQIILLNTLISEFNIIDNPFKHQDKNKKDGSILGLRLLENRFDLSHCHHHHHYYHHCHDHHRRLIVLGSRGWVVMDMTGSMVSVVTVPSVSGQDTLVHSVVITTPDTAAVVCWSGLESSCSRHEL